MQPTDKNEVSRRALDVEDYVDIVARHKSWILGPFLFGLVAAVVGAYLWPDTYVSQAIVKIVPQQVPPNMVPSAIMQDLTDRINSMAQTVESRTELLNIINTLNLYPKERKRRPDTDIVEDMKKKIDITPVSSLASVGGARMLPAFAISFTYDDKHLAQKVVEALVSKFIDENQRARSRQSFETTQFLKDQTESAKKDLDDIEQHLTEFRVQNNGKLPDQVETNLRQVQALQSNLAMASTNVARAQQEKLALEANLRIYRDQYNLISKSSGPTQTVNGITVPTDRFAQIDGEIAQLDAQLLVLRQHYKDTWPDVQIALERRAAALKRREEILTGKPSTPPVDADAQANLVTAIPVNPQAARDVRELEVNIQRLESSLEQKDLEIAQLEKEIKKTTDQVRSFQAKIEAAPLGERQYTAFITQQSIAKSKYVAMQENLGKAQVSAEMEGRKQGETLEVLDPASLPGTPTEPKRPLVISIGAAIGLLLGIVFAAVREVKDTSLKNLKDVRAYTELPVLSSVPLMEAESVIRRRKRIAWLGWTTACLASAAIMAASIAYYYVVRA